MSTYTHHRGYMRRRPFPTIQYTTHYRSKALSERRMGSSCWLTINDDCLDEWRFVPQLSFANTRHIRKNQIKILPPGNKFWVRTVCCTDQWWSFSCSAGLDTRSILKRRLIAPLDEVENIQETGCNGTDEARNWEGTDRHCNYSPTHLLISPN